MDALDIDGAWVFTPRIHRDARGSFLEWLRDSEFRADLGYRPEFAQANCSVSRKGVIRGVHFAGVPPGQAKYVTCVAGVVLDVIVDVRTGAPGFGRWTSVVLDDQTRRAVFISEGLGHAFMTLSEESTVMYLCSTPYIPGREHGVHPLDPALGISWPQGVQPILSERDATASSLAEAQASGILPAYRDCLAHTARLRGERPAARPGELLDPLSSPP
ncbi:MAG TPA: dTDP-4-dehydrorhamnose 3,5-epimerase [Streptosporangiaceae bacterium]